MQHGAQCSIEYLGFGYVHLRPLNIADDFVYHFQLHLLL